MSKFYSCKRKKVITGNQLLFFSQAKKKLTQQVGKLNHRSRIATSRSQKDIRTESLFTATPGIRTCDLWDANAPL
jgi:hypothetical protein